MKTLKITRIFVFRMTVATKFVCRICLSTMKLLRVGKRCPVAILFVNISLATVTSSTVTSSKLNVENSAKAQCVDETHSYRFLKFEKKKKKIKEFYENAVKLREII